MFEKIKKYLYRVISILKYSTKIKLYNAIVRKSSIDIPSISNEVILRNVEIIHSEFLINGKNNHIELNKSSYCIYNLSLKIFGDNNNVRIDENAIIYGLRIIIRGNGCQVSIGRNFSENQNCTIVCMGENNYIKIGHDCLFSSDIDIWNTDSHRILNASGDIVNSCLPVKIGNHVWIGKRSCILKGVTLGDNSIVGFSSVVTKNIEEKSIYAGNPARKIKGEISWSKEYVKN